VFVFTGDSSHLLFFIGVELTESLSCRTLQAGLFISRSPFLHGIRDGMR